MLGRILRGGKFAVIFKSAAIGTPLPLCSCSVLPVAHQLRESGVSRGGTAAFLVSTPETGVDSILLTYSLMDPLMTVARPVAGFVTAMVAGLSIESGNNPVEVAKNPLEVKTESCCHGSSETEVETKEPFFKRLVDSLRYSFVKMLGDLSPYLIIGYILAGLVAVILGGDIADIPQSFRTGWAGYAAALVIGLPLYVCATSSTPLAAVLLTSGFSPGAIMVFLLVGPATNAASITVAKKILGGRSLVRYLIAIVVVAILCGIAIDFVYDLLDFKPQYILAQAHEHVSWVNFIAAVVFSVWVLILGLRRLVKRFS